MSKYPKKNPPHPPFNLTSSIENRPCGLTCCCWDWWPWASACPPSPRAKTPACWSGGTARSRSSSCPSVKRRKDGRAVSRRGLAATAERTVATCTLTSGGSWLRKLWSAAKVRMLPHWPMEVGKASISLKLQSSSSRDASLNTGGGTFITRVITVFTADYS